MAPQRIVVRRASGCDPSCCGCSCIFPVLLIPAFMLFAWVHATVGRGGQRSGLESWVQVGVASPLSRFAVGFIEMYRRLLSGRLGLRCRFEPSCSTYGLEAYGRYGFAKATRLTIWRVLRCNPLSRSPMADPL